MANAFTTQILKDTTEHVIVKLTGKFDGNTQEDNPNRIDVSTLSNALNANATPGLLSDGGSELPYYGINLHRIWYDTTNGTTGDVELYWNANPVVTMLMLSGNSEYDGAGNWVTISNAAKGTTDCNGDVGIRTRGMVANTSYTIVMEFRKENEYYQRGQLTEPGAFNYNGVKP